MSETVIASLIGGIALIGSVVVAALMGLVINRLGKIRKDTKATSEHIVNDHGEKNFREENDSRHAETLRLFGEVGEKLDIVTVKLGQVEDLSGALLTGWFEHDEAIDNIENTLGDKKNV